MPELFKPGPNRTPQNKYYNQVSVPVRLLMNPVSSSDMESSQPNTDSTLDTEKESEDLDIAEAQAIVIAIKKSLQNDPGNVKDVTTEDEVLVTEEDDEEADKAKKKQDLMLTNLQNKAR